MKDAACSFGCTPSPALPTEGEGAGSATGEALFGLQTQPDTSPLGGGGWEGALAPRP